MRKCEIYKDVVGSFFFYIYIYTETRCVKFLCYGYDNEEIHEKLRRLWRFL